MDKRVKRVTVVESDGENRQARVVYEKEKGEEDGPSLGSFESKVRHLLKADLIRAQEAYDRHVASASKGRGDWLFDAPENIRKSFDKAKKEARMAFPESDDDDEDEED